MFSSFRRTLPQISIFHNPSSPPSLKALSLLRSSLSGPYPPTNPSNPPLDFNLEIVEHPPTVDQLKTIQSYSSAPSISASQAQAQTQTHPTQGTQTQTTTQDTATVPPTFLSAHYSAPSGADRAALENPSTLATLAAQNPTAIKWPIVVDWLGGRVSVGDVDGVRGMLESLRRKRDGEEVADEDRVDQPKGWFT